MMDTDNMWLMLQRISRIWKLMFYRGMAFEAARTVVDAAMFGIGCIEGQVRARIEEEKRGVKAG